MITLYLSIIYICLCAIFYNTSKIDFVSYKISNKNIIIIICLYALFYSVDSATSSLINSWSQRAKEVYGSFELFDPGGDFIAAALLFATGFVLWMMRLLGAGDAKLLFPIGLFTGMDYLMPFALALIAFGTAALIFLKSPHSPKPANNKIAARLAAIRETGKVPYSVILSTAFLVTLAIKYMAAIA